MYEKRPDLIYCGRTLFGAKPPKGQEMDDHYFGAIKPKVAEFMEDLDETLWKLGVLAKTESQRGRTRTARIGADIHHHQHRLRPQPADDGNDEASVASRHGLACLLHEKPFDGRKRLGQAQQLVAIHRHAA